MGNVSAPVVSRGSTAEIWIRPYDQPDEWAKSAFMFVRNDPNMDSGTKIEWDMGSPTKNEVMTYAAFIQAKPTSLRKLTVDEIRVHAPYICS